MSFPVVDTVSRSNGRSDRNSTVRLVLVYTCVIFATGLERVNFVFSNSATRVIARTKSKPFNYARHLCSQIWQRPFSSFGLGIYICIYCWRNGLKRWNWEEANKRGGGRGCVCVCAELLRETGVRRCRRARPEIQCYDQTVRFPRQNLSSWLRIILFWIQTVGFLLHSFEIVSPLVKIKLF